MDEYRLWITIPGFPFSAEERWEPFTEKLERDWSSLAPVFTWSDDAIVAIIATDAADPANAARIGVEAVTDALRATALGDRYPASVEVERVEERELQPA